MLRFGWEPDYTGRLVISSREDSINLLNQEVTAALESGRVAIDTETTGLSTLDGARAFLFSFTYPIDPKRDDINELIRSKAIRKVPQGKNRPPLWVRSVACFIGDRHIGKPAAATDIPTVHGCLNRLLNGPAHLVMFNAKFDLAMFWADGHSTQAYARDVSLDLYVLDPGFGDSIVEVREARRAGLLKEAAPLPRNLKDLSWLLLNWPAEERDEVLAWLKHKFGNDKKRWKYHALPIELVGTYACGDTERTLALSYWTESRLIEREQTTVASNESLLAALVADMELQGVALHEAEIQEVRGQWIERGTKAQDRLLELTGLAHLEYNKDEHLAQYAWPALNQRAREAGTKEYKVPSGWSAEALAQFVVKKRGAGLTAERTAATGLHGEFCEALLTQRAMGKIVDTYLDPWVLKHGVRHDDGVLRVHCELLQDGTDTGRFSSRNPNMQNVPVEARLLTPDPGHSLVFIDYSQIEFRLFAHYAGGSILQAYLDDPDTDFHQAVADLLKMPRKPAKNINFAALYGMGQEKAISDLSAYMPRDEAIRCYHTYHQRFPVARQLYRKCQQRVEERGWIKNLYGRRRYMPKEFAQKALNTLCQGGAADIVKAAMLRVDRAMQNTKQDLIRESRLVLQIHDELIFKVPSGAEQALIDYVSPIMVDEPLCKVPLRVEAEVCLEGEVWRDKHTLGEAHE